MLSILAGKPLQQNIDYPARPKKSADDITHRQNLEKLFQATIKNVESELSPWT